MSVFLGAVKKDRFVVEPITKFGMLFGYVVYDTKLKVKTDWEYDEKELGRAEAKARLLSLYDREF